MSAFVISRGARESYLEARVANELNCEKKIVSYVCQYKASLERYRSNQKIFFKRIFDRMIYRLKFFTPNIQPESNFYYWANMCPVSAQVFLLETNFNLRMFLNFRCQDDKFYMRMNQLGCKRLGKFTMDDLKKKYSERDVKVKYADMKFSICKKG